MKAVLYFLPLLASASFVSSLPSLAAKESALPGSFVSEVSQLIATQLLNHNKDIDANQVYSPVGVVTILATLAEAADGETYSEFGQVLGFPKERQDLRAGFEPILAGYQKKDTGTGLPLFHTYFYVYRNNSAREDYKELLQRHYYTEMQELYSKEYDLEEQSNSTPEGSGTDGDSTEPSNSKDVIGFETLKRINLDDDAPVGTPNDNYGEEVINKEASKFDRDVDDKQYVEKPVALAEAEELQRERLTTEQTATDADSSSTDAPLEKLEKPAEITLTVKENLAEKQQNKRSDANAEQNPNVEENETVQEDEKLRKLPNEPNTAGNQVTDSEPEKVSLPLQKLENAVKTMVKEGADEIMIALESHLSSVARVCFRCSIFW